MVEPARTPELSVRLQDALGSERYTIERELTGGGMSRVFLATELVLRRHVVVKVLPPDLAAALSAERFRREMLLAAKLQHPHIVPVLSAGELGELLYYVMPYVAGESLRGRLGAPLPVDEVTRILRDVARALAFAHKRGIVHRDIKPENILLDDDAVLVTDFGVAKALSEAGAGSQTLTGVGLALGTPAYMAPEQALADPGLDHRADLYSLGVVAYEMLTGALPFDRPTTQALLAAHLMETPPTVASKRPDVTPAMSDLVARLLAKEPAERPQSADELLTALNTTTASAIPAATSTRRRLALVAGGIVLAGAVGYAAIIARRTPAAPLTIASTPRSLAVLPFVNLSADRDNEYFSDGMTEELIDALANIDGLQVAARTSSFAFKGKNSDVREIGRQLDVGAVLEGSVRRDGNRLRITAQLVNATNGYHIWSRTYERQVNDAFAMQDEIARTIADTLRLKLGGAATVAARKPTENTEAYELYLRGRFFSNSRRNADELQKAIGFFRQALALDSGYARAYSGLADSYSLLAIFGGMRPDSVFPPAKAAALRAIALDSTLAEAHTSLGIVHLLYDWDFAAGGRELSRAIALNPSYPPAHLFRGWILMVSAQADSGVAEIARARQLDPLNLLISTRVGTALIYAGRFAEARAQLERTLRLDSTYMLARHQVAILDALEGRAPRQAAEVHVPDLVANADADYVGISDEVRARRGDALAIARALEARSRQRYVPPDAIAGIFTTLGERDSAFVWLERALQARSSTLTFAGVEPIFIPLRSDPRFARLKARIGVK